jgi:hypothetical protein
MPAKTTACPPTIYLRRTEAKYSFIDPHPIFNWRAQYDQKVPSRFKSEIVGIHLVHYVRHVLHGS